MHDGVTSRRARMLTLLGERLVVDLLEVDDEHAEAVGDAAAYHRDDEHARADEPALPVGVDDVTHGDPRHAQLGPYDGHAL